MSKRKFFISHRSANKTLAAKLRDDLSAFEAADVWLDIDHLAPGDTLDEIGDSIARCDVLLVLWHEKTDASKWVQREIELAEQHDVRIIPCVHDVADLERAPLLSRRIYIDFSVPEIGLARLCLAEIAPLLLDDAGTRLARELVGVLGHVTAKLADPEFIEHDDWKQRFDRLEAELRDAVDESARRTPAHAADCKRLLGTLDALNERLGPMLTEEMHTSRIDLNDFFGDDGSFRLPESRGSAHTSASAATAPRAARLSPGGHVAGAQDESGDDITAYVAAAWPALAEVNTWARQSGSLAGLEVVACLDAYLNEPEDLLPDHIHDQLGRADDAFLVHNTVYRLVEAGLLPPGAVPVDWTLIARGDAALRALLPPDTVLALEGLVSQYVGLLWHERSQDYHPATVGFAGRDAFLMDLDGLLTGLFADESGFGGIR